MTLITKTAISLFISAMSIFMLAKPPAPTAQEMRSFLEWFDFYADKFARISNDALKGYWYIYGRDSEETAPPREMAAWSAVNAAMEDRGL